jgi:hypothetical protein
MYLKLLRILGLVELVWLKDWNGVIYLSEKKKDPFGGYWCHVYPVYKVGHVKLNDDGTCGGESSYIEQWVNY